MKSWHWCYWAMATVFKASATELALTGAASGLPGMWKVQIAASEWRFSSVILLEQRHFLSTTEHHTKNY